MRDCLSVWSLCGIFLFLFWQYGGAIYNAFSGSLTFKGSATFTSCSAEASGSSYAYAVSGGECLSVEAQPLYGDSNASKIKSDLICR